MEQLKDAFCLMKQDSTINLTTLSRAEDKLLPKEKKKYKTNYVDESYISLKQLILSFNDITDPAVFDTFGAGVCKSGLLELNLSNNALGDASIKHLAFSIGSS